MRMFLLIAGVFTLGFTVNAAEEKIDRTMAFNSGGEVTLQNVNGKVTIRGWDRNEIRIVAVKKARSGDAREKLERTQVQIEADGDRFIVETVLPKERKWRNNVSVAYELWVPSETNVNARTTNGAMALEGVWGDLNLRSTNGSVKALDAGGRINAKTTNGSITVEMGSYEGGDMELISTNGSINFTGPEDLAVNVQASCTNGTVRTDYDMLIKGEVSKRRLNGSINGGGNALTMRTTNGSIRINRD